jgi:hypothetical protein
MIIGGDERGHVVDVGQTCPPRYPMASSSPRRPAAPGDLGDALSAPRSQKMGTEG